MPGRSYSAGTGYRYGFNGKEQDPEVSGQGNQYDYGFRIYNPRLGRFLSVDPLFNSYPWYTPYQFAGNMPIWAIDLDGLEEKKATIINVVRVFDTKGNLIKEPTRVEYGATGNTILATPSTQTVRKGDDGGDIIEERTDFRQIEGIKFSIFSYSVHKSFNPEPDKKVNTVQENEDPIKPGDTEDKKPDPVISWRRGTETIVEPLINRTYISQPLDISFQYNKGRNDGTGFTNNDVANASIAAYAQRLKDNGLSSADVTISADYKSFGEYVRNHGTVGALIEARGNTVRGAFAKYGVSVNNVIPSLGTPGVSASSTTTVSVQIGWRSTTYPIRQKTINGKPTGSVQQSGAGTSKPQIGGSKPAGGRRWGG